MTKIERKIGATRVTIDLPLWIDTINCFLFKGEDGWDIVDAGTYTPKAMEKWRQTFREFDINPLDVKKIIITHDHVDHFGAAGELHKLTQAPVKMVHKDNTLLNWKDWLKKILHEETVFHYFGLPEELERKIISEKIGQFQSWAPSIPKIEDLRGSNTIQLGSEQYSLLKFSGHCDEQVCFYNQDMKVLFAGDVLVTPNHINMASQDPLGLYFETLELLKNMEISYLIPSHGKPFGRVGIRIGLISEYRKQQLIDLTEHLSQATTVYQAYLFLLTRGALTDLFFGVTEVYYFLEHLVKTGHLKKETRKDCLYYMNYERR
ncbi:MAG: hypothetical protein APF84_09820 [Gracilibacter sp. BRH_c7a]|nr:MAG: hypothetical protein APF84_09820 [Gracilibacter sp. BRH_c7a]